MPPANEQTIPPEELASGLNLEALYDRFREYIRTCRALQRNYASSMRVLVGFEAEVCSGYETRVDAILKDFAPDYFVGSVHHVDDVPIDMTPEFYRRAVNAHGSIEHLYCRYFDLQLELIERFKPSVIGHFDLIRIFDSEYLRTMEDPAVWSRVERNLERIRALDLSLDFNVRAISKGASEPYPTKRIVEKARALGIAMLPGDDSHGVATVGLHLDEGIALLEQMGFSTAWRMPSR
jgi:histidinol-phosphatase (PHP family)